MNNLKIIPLSAIPSQQFKIVINNQNCTIALRQKNDYMYMDLKVDNNMVFEGRICLVAVDMIQYPTQYFTGHLMFANISGLTDLQPHYENLGGKTFLAYWSD